MTGDLFPPKPPYPFLASALARTRILVFVSFLTGSHVDFIDLAHLENMLAEIMSVRSLKYITQLLHQYY